MKVIPTRPYFIPVNQDDLRKLAAEFGWDLWVEPTVNKHVYDVMMAYSPPDDDHCCNMNNFPCHGLEAAAKELLAIRKERARIREARGNDGMIPLTRLRFPPGAPSSP